MLRPLTVSTRSDTHIDAVLRKISHRVLEDVWMSARVRALLAALAVTLIGAAVTGWLGLAGQAATSWISYAAIVLFGLAASASSLAVGLRRFRWCCAAAYLSGLATVAGWAMVWWHRTAPSGTVPRPCGWMVIGVVAVTALAVTWLGVILTPAERSQPDMRAASAPARARSGPPSS